ncbi:hypothetical protein QBC37DRAFT_398294 [Rhypophila decipiens]|uniref:Uncharacterized protein n=1 Tax=Rhypophila decipiens TaxID=261697 RepID=A0AAN6YCW0_9PEZI|nr:hypothetical protein QBC37DRAFT_398294 [Rhypophila decipiens]
MPITARMLSLLLASYHRSLSTLKMSGRQVEAQALWIAVRKLQGETRVFMREHLPNDVGRGLLATGRGSALADSCSGMVEISLVFDSEPSDDPADGDGARPLARSIPSSGLIFRVSRRQEDNKILLAVHEVVNTGFLLSPGVRTVLRRQQLTPKVATARSLVALNLDYSVQVTPCIRPPARGNKQPAGVKNHVEVWPEKAQIAKKPLLGEADLQPPSPLGRPRVVNLHSTEGVHGVRLNSYLRLWASFPCDVKWLEKIYFLLALVSSATVVLSFLFPLAGTTSTRGVGVFRDWNDIVHQRAARNLNISSSSNNIWASPTCLPTPFPPSCPFAIFKMCIHHYTHCIICYGKENNKHWVEQCSKYRDELGKMNDQTRAKYPDFCSQAYHVLPHDDHIERNEGNAPIPNSSTTPRVGHATQPETQGFMGSMSEIQPEPQEDDEDEDLAEQFHSYNNQQSEQPDHPPMTGFQESEQSTAATNTNPSFFPAHENAVLADEDIFQYYQEQESDQSSMPTLPNPFPFPAPWYENALPQWRWDTPFGGFDEPTPPNLTFPWSMTERVIAQADRVLSQPEPTAPESSNLPTPQRLTEPATLPSKNRKRAAAESDDDCITVKGSGNAKRRKTATAKNTTTKQKR